MQEPDPLKWRDLGHHAYSSVSYRKKASTYTAIVTLWITFTCLALANVAVFRSILGTVVCWALNLVSLATFFVFSRAIYYRFSRQPKKIQLTDAQRHYLGLEHSKNVEEVDLVDIPPDKRSSAPVSFKFLGAEGNVFPPHPTSPAGVHSSPRTPSSPYSTPPYATFTPRPKSSPLKLLVIPSPVIHKPLSHEELILQHSHIRNLRYHTGRCLTDVSSAQSFVRSRRAGRQYTAEYSSVSPYGSPSASSPMVEEPLLTTPMREYNVAQRTTPTKKPASKDEFGEQYTIDAENQLRTFRWFRVVEICDRQDYMQQWLRKRVLGRVLQLMETVRPQIRNDRATMYRAYADCKEYMRKKAEGDTQGNSTASPFGSFSFTNTTANEEEKKKREKEGKERKDFLELYMYASVLECHDLEYLWDRISRLAEGTYLSQFEYNGGGTWRGKPWSTNYPTDSQIIIHLFCVFFDQKMYPDQRCPTEERPFTRLHFRYPGNPKDKYQSRIVIHQREMHPPHFEIIADSKRVKIVEGRSNLMRSLIIFTVLVREILNCKLSSNVDIGSSTVGLLQELHIPRTGDLIQILFSQ